MSKIETKNTKFFKLLRIFLYLSKNIFYSLISPNSSTAKTFLTNVYILSLLPKRFVLDGRPAEVRAQELIEEERQRQLRNQSEKKEREQRFEKELKELNERLALEESFYQKKRFYHGLIHYRYNAEKKEFTDWINSRKGQGITLHFRNPQDFTQTWVWHLKVDTGQLAQKWFQLLWEHLSKSHLEKNFTFMGLVNRKRNLSFLSQLMNHYINIINQFSKKNIWPNPIHINLQFNEKLVFEKGQDLFNQLHKYFEVLIGQVENHSPYFLTADPPTQFAIKQINQLCHEMEYLLRAHNKIQDPHLGPDEVSATLQFSLLEYTRTRLTQEEASLFTTERDFGQIYLHYGQLGKTHQEAFWDHDNLVGQENINDLQYLTPQFDIDIGPFTLSHYLPDAHFSWETEEKLIFEQWLKSRGKDSQGIGRINVGKLLIGQFEWPYISLIQKKLAAHSDLYSITLQDFDQEKSQTMDFPYVDNGLSYLNHQEDLLMLSSQEHCQLKSSPPHNEVGSSKTLRNSEAPVEHPSSFLD